MPTEWLQVHFDTETARQKWKCENFIDDIPSNMNLFLDFYNARREKMKVILAQILDVKITD